MSAYVVVHGTVKDADKMQEYGGAAGPTVVAHGGEVVARGPATVLSGTSDHQIAVVLKFPDAAAAKGWYESPEYQALIPVRKQALDSVFVVVGE
ncbi:MAG: DUF1330 domain-containing protein [Gammaproteobacteria bacterium]|jgi:uncharacterized protein (DUF1330 family)